MADQRGDTQTQQIRGSTGSHEVEGVVNDELAAALAGIEPLTDALITG
jgi:hypothetical protein